MQETNGAEGVGSRSDNLHISQGWKVDGKTHHLDFFLHSAKCFSILPAVREANKKQASSHQRTLKSIRTEGTRYIWWQGCEEPEQEQLIESLEEV